jgi:hypothetical protein
MTNSEFQLGKGRLGVLKEADEPFQSPVIVKGKPIVTDNSGATPKLPPTEQEPAATRKDKADITDPMVDKAADNWLRTAVVETEKLVVLGDYRAKMEPPC